MGSGMDENMAGGSWTISPAEYMLQLTNNVNIG